MASMVLCVITMRLNLDYLRRSVVWIGAIALVLLVLVLIPHLGVSVKGSRRWLGYGAARLQGSWNSQSSPWSSLPGGTTWPSTRRGSGDWKRGYLYPLAIIGRRSQAFP